MSWYVLQCRSGREGEIIRSCRQHISADALKEVFSFRCERLWRTDGVWKLVEKEMFPGYVFLESSRPDKLSEELEAYRKILRVMEEPGYLISVYEEEEEYLRKLCGERHYLKMSFGYKDKEKGRSFITEGPLKGLENQIAKYDWHRRFAQLRIPVSRKEVVVWAGIGFDERILVDRDDGRPGIAQEEMQFLVS